MIIIRGENNNWLYRESRFTSDFILVEGKRLFYNISTIYGEHRKNDYITLKFTCDIKEGMDTF